MNHSYLLAGISTRKLLSLLVRNGFSLRPRYLVRILFLLQGSLFSSVFNRVANRKYAGKTGGYNMPADPVFIIGHWRTGTTLLHQLMSLDDNLVTPTLFQVSAPASFLVSEKYYRPVISKLVGNKRPMDNVKLGFDEPQEDEYALIKLTADSPLEKMLFPAGKKFFLEEEDVSLPRNEEKWLNAVEEFALRLSFSKKKRVLFKNPFHGLRIPLLLKRFPEAKFIHIHRHPYQVIPSTIHMWNIVGDQNKLNKNNLNTSIASVSSVFGKFIDKVKNDLQDVAEHNKIEVGYDKLVGDPVTTMKNLYHKLGLPWTNSLENSMLKYIGELGSYKRNTYNLSANDKDEIKNILGKHFIYYNYPG